MNQEAGDSAQKSRPVPSRPPRRSGAPRRRGGRGRRRPGPRDPNLATPEAAPISGENPSSVSTSEPVHREPIREQSFRAPASVQPRPQPQRRTGSPIAEATAQVEDVI